MDKPSGCIIWIIVTPELVLHSYLWLGGPPGQPLPDIQDMRVASIQRQMPKATKLNGQTIGLSHVDGLKSLARSTRFWNGYLGH